MQPLSTKLDQAVQQADAHAKERLTQEYYSESPTATDKQWHELFEDASYEAGKEILHHPAFKKGRATNIFTYYLDKDNAHVQGLYDRLDSLSVEDDEDLEFLRHVFQELITERKVAGRPAAPTEAKILDWLTRKLTDIALQPEKTVAVRNSESAHEVPATPNSPITEDIPDAFLSFNPPFTAQRVDELARELALIDAEGKLQLTPRKQSLLIDFIRALDKENVIGDSSAVDKSRYFSKRYQYHKEIEFLKPTKNSEARVKNFRERIKAMRKCHEALPPARRPGSKLAK